MALMTLASYIAQKARVLEVKGFTSCSFKFPVDLGGGTRTASALVANGVA